MSVSVSDSSTPTIGDRQTRDWRSALKDAVRDVDELLGLVQVARQRLPPIDADPDFPLLVPREFVTRMEIGNPKDPLLLQVLPLAEEQVLQPGFSADPLQEVERATRDGVLSKYRGRALLVTTGACPVHCRYCFRRHFPYSEASLRGSLQGTLKRLGEEPHQEVILSGGDPLALSNRRLAHLLEELKSLPGLKRVRLHSRFPVILPQRVDAGLVQLLGRYDLPVVMVIHCNHGNELSAAVLECLQDLAGAGVTLLNQAVLLKGVNDRASAQIDLAERLFEAQVLPYYLHQLDPVAGAAHFQVDDQRAKALMRDVAARLPGYLTPKLVREVPGAPGKTVLI